MAIYCTTDDIKFQLSAAGAVAAMDDFETGVLSAEGTEWLEQAIEWAASEIEAQAQHQYRLSELSSSNVWLQRANAILAAELICRRRNSPVPESLASAAQQIKSDLIEIRWGRKRIPRQAPSADHTPAVSNFTVEPRKVTNPVRVVKAESTGDDPPDGITRHLAGDPTRY